MLAMLLVVCLEMQMGLEEPSKWVVQWQHSTVSVSAEHSQQPLIANAGCCFQHNSATVGGAINLDNAESQFSVRGATIGVNISACRFIEVGWL